MKLILSGGGTGGHVSPALAIAEAVKKRHKDCEIMFIGREGGDENRPVKAAGYKIHELRVRGIKRKITLDNFKSLLLAIKAEREAYKIIRNFHPDAVVGTGGYVCWPVLHAASRAGIPTAIHESNLVPGLVTRTLAPRCTRVLLNYEKSREYLKRKDNLLTVGNPLRAEFQRLKRNEARAKLGIKPNEIYVVSFGGSGGAEILNETICKVMKEYSAEMRRLIHLHACGRRYFSKYKNALKNTSGCEIREYIDNMPYHLKAADIVICRCGAMTLSEIAASGAAAILIPSPNVTDNHQYKNGRYFSELGAAVMIEERDLTSERLMSEIKRLIDNKEERRSLSEKVKRLSDPSSAERIANEIEKMTGINGV